MSENSNECTSRERQRLDRATSIDVCVHVHDKTEFAVRVHPDEKRVVLRLGDTPAIVSISIDELDLDRLHAVIHDAFGQLDRPTIYAADEAPEAWASGWDAAISWVQDSTDEPVPASVPGGAS